MSLSKPKHGEKINIKGLASKVFFDLLEQVAVLYSLSSLPDETEIVFINGKASLQLITFLQDAADAAGLYNQPSEGEKIILDDGSASQPFQAFIDNLAE